MSCLQTIACPVNTEIVYHNHTSPSGLLGSQEVERKRQPDCLVSLVKSALLEAISL